MSNSPFAQICFPHLYTARAPSPNSEPRFSMIALFDKDAQGTPEYAAMRKAVVDAAVAKFGNNAVDMLKNGQIRSPFRNATEKSKYDGFTEGKMFVSPWTSKQPGVIDGKLQDVMEKDVYPGMIGRFTYTVFAYDNSGNKGVSFGLNNVQITDFTAPRLDGRVAANKEFDAVDMPVSDMPDGSSGYDMDDVPF